jgi:hypothetical protein
VVGQPPVGRRGVSLTLNSNAGPEWAATICAPRPNPQTATKNNAPQRRIFFIDPPKLRANRSVKCPRPNAMPTVFTAHHPPLQEDAVTCSRLVSATDLHQVQSGQGSEILRDHSEGLGFCELRRSSSWIVEEVGHGRLEPKQQTGLSQENMGEAGSPASQTLETSAVTDCLNPPSLGPTR